MGDKTTIEWSDATWNVVTGCTQVSPGCAHCYIERTPPFRIAGRAFDSHGVIPLMMHEDRLTLPLQWKRPRRIFVNSLSDLFHEQIDPMVIGRMLDVMGTASWHQFQVLTKRAARMVNVMHAYYDARDAVPYPHVWMGVTAENAHWVRDRVPMLRATPAAIRFLSLEPLLDDVSVALREQLEHGGVHWVIAGFESGPQRRPMVLTDAHREWVRRIRDVCEECGVAFFFKQWGGLSAKSGGRTLDGRTYDGYPVTA